MSHQARLHAAGAYYYVTQRCCPGQQLFSKEEDYSEFSKDFAELVKRYQVKIHAFVWLPSEIHLLVQVSDLPLTRMMRSLMQLFAYRVDHKEDSQPLFPRRYSAVLFDPEEYFLRAIRFVHSQAPQLEEYEWSSHQPYKGEAKVPWLTTHNGLGLFNRHTHRSQRAYVAFMELPLPDEDVQAFSNVLPTEQRVLGSTIFLRRMGLKARARSKATIQSVAESVSRNMGVELQEVLSRSRRQEVSQVRAAIALEIKIRRLAPQAAAARYFGRGRSTLHGIVEHHAGQDRRDCNVRPLRRPGPVMTQAAIALMLKRSESVAASA